MSSVIDGPKGPYVPVPLAEWERLRRNASQATALADQFRHLAATMNEVIVDVESEPDELGQ